MTSEQRRNVSIQLITCTVFKAIFNRIFGYIAAASAPIRTFLELIQSVLRTIFFPSNCLLSDISIVQTINSGERGINPVAMTNQFSERILAHRGSNQLPHVLKSCALSTELWGSAKILIQIRLLELCRLN